MIVRGTSVPTRQVLRERSLMGLASLPSSHSAHAKTGSRGDSRGLGGAWGEESSSRSNVSYGHSGNVPPMTSIVFTALALLFWMVSPSFQV